jgi:alkanesulfonate monooxygenase SsuD/methylene tetrahydromethanopterin reductase-like flavin-dependent oxidoreductase (luciferase family)
VGDLPDPLIWLTAAAAATKHVDLGIAVSYPALAQPG